MDQERFDTISRTLASGLSRRGVLRALSIVGAGGFLAVGQTASAGERPHQRLQDRTPQRNRKQRNKNDNQNKNDNNTGGGQLGSGDPGPFEPSADCKAKCQEQFEGCMEPCAGSQGTLEFCVERCTTEQGECEERCLTA